jgi:hypothetical protein
MNSRRPTRNVISSLQPEEDSVGDRITPLQTRPALMRRQALRIQPGWQGELMAAYPESIYKSGHEQRCFGAANSGWSYACWTYPSRARPFGWVSPSICPILGKQGHQPADQCRLNARQHRAGVHSTWGHSILNTKTRRAIALIQCYLPLRGKLRMLSFVKGGSINTVDKC